MSRPRPVAFTVRGHELHVFLLDPELYTVLILPSFPGPLHVNITSLVLPSRGSVQWSELRTSREAQDEEGSSVDGDLSEIGLDEETSQNALERRGVKRARRTSSGRDAEPVDRTPTASTHEDLPSEPESEPDGPASSSARAAQASTRIGEYAQERRPVPAAELVDLVRDPILLNHISQYYASHGENIPTSIIRAALDVEQPRSLQTSFPSPSSLPRT